MAINSFYIKRLSDDTIIDLIDVDSIVCKEFNFEFSEQDYGRFYFSESKEELKGFQTYITWAGLLHVIIYYSRINYGKCIAYDVEAAFAWVNEYAIHFPHSATVFISKLMKFFESQGWYVFVLFSRT